MSSMGCGNCFQTADGRFRRYGAVSGGQFGAGAEEAALGGELHADMAV